MVQILSMPDTTNKPNVPDNSIDYNDLDRLGLSRTAIACYAALAENGPGTAGELAKRLGRPRTSVYHALNKLLIWGYVESSKSIVLPQATRFRAVRLDKALENLAIYQRRAVRELIDLQIEKSIKSQTLLGLKGARRDWR